ncbi:MAG: hypothetical protein AB7I37_06440 [Pirellulales bacterium]
MLGTLDIDEAAQKAAGNWQRFDSFVWFRDKEVADADRWAIIYTHNRDSGLLDQSNASVIAKAMAPFALADDPDVVFESHSHWAVGHVDGFSLRVFDSNGEITEALQRYHELAQAMDEYPILDESDYSDREYESTIENIVDAAWRMKKEFTLPEGWESDVYSWLSDHRPGEVENRDDRGGYPSEEALKLAFTALGFQPSE